MARRDALDVLKHDPAIGYSTTRTLTLLTGPSFFEATHASRTTTCFKTLLMDTGRTTQPLHPPRHAHTLLHTSCDTVQTRTDRQTRLPKRQQTSRSTRLRLTHAYTTLRTQSATHRPALWGLADARSTLEIASDSFLDDMRSRSHEATGSSPAGEDETLVAGLQ
jgi:hypothetical protein